MKIEIVIELDELPDDSYLQELMDVARQEGAIAKATLIIDKPIVRDLLEAF